MLLIRVSEILGLYSYFLVKIYSFYSFCQEKSSNELCLINCTFGIIGFITRIFYYILKILKACHIEILLDRIAAGNIKIINIFRY